MTLLLWHIGLLMVLVPAQLISQNLTTDMDQSPAKIPAQVKPWQFGVLGGFQFSTIEGDLTEDHSYIGDFSAGVYAWVLLFPPLGLMTELYYAGLGTGFVTIGDSKLHLDYLVLPVMFTYEFKPKLNLGLGPYFGFLLKARDQGDDFEEIITDLISGLDVGVKLGVYYQVTEVINLGFTFNRGFINTQSGGRMGRFKQYNQSIMFTTSVNLTKILTH
jgi:hypothetical protein